MTFMAADASQGFGGKFGVQTERVDKSAKGYGDHTAPELHPSQTDHKKGFGGKFGVQADRVDKVGGASSGSEPWKLHCICYKMHS